MTTTKTWAQIAKTHAEEVPAPTHLGISPCSKVATPAPKGKPSTKPVVVETTRVTCFCAQSDFPGSCEGKLTSFTYGSRQVVFCSHHSKCGTCYKPVVSSGFEMVDVGFGERPVCKECVNDPEQNILRCMACATMYKDHAYDDCGLYCPKCGCHEYYSDFL